MNILTRNRVRVLTVTDAHQSKLHFRALAHAISEHRPDAVAFVGDVLDAVQYSSRKQLTTKECARELAALPVEHLLFVRGNHEDTNWPKFVAAWPHDRRPLIALYGTACAIGPLVIVGFPCLTGSEIHWCSHLPATGNNMELCPLQSRKPLPPDFEAWLPELMRKTGPAGRAVWLMHEPPVSRPIANPSFFNHIWSDALERFSPWLAVCGHDHRSPLQNNYS